MWTTVPTAPPAIALGVVLLASPRLAADATENLSTYARGIYAERAGETGVARRHFEATLAADPDSFEVASKTARTQFADEDPLTIQRMRRTFVNPRA